MDIEGVLNKHRALVEEKLREYKGLISRETAAYIVAQEMGLDIEEQSTPELLVSHLAPGMRRVHLTGKVLAAGPLELYTRKDASTCKIQRLLMRDESGKVEILLWEPEVEVKVGDLLRIQGGYIRNIEEGLQLSVGETGSVEILGFEALHLSEIIDGAENLTVRAPLLRVYPDKLFQSKQGGVFRASGLTLFENGVRARVIFWEEEAEKPVKLKPFQVIELTALQASFNASGLPELKVSSATSIVVRGKVEPVLNSEISPSEVLHPELDVDIRGQLSSISKEPERATVTLRDEKAEIQLLIMHQEPLTQLATIASGDLIEARFLDVIRSSSRQLEGRSTIWTEFSRQ